ncbi:ricin-type beta-trefoil lectin domain protein [Parahaliea sp. F7430]|uniref:Ricin-type beta-trefoil lectin domain protein n=1 Tax=Sediminihaliea albiluteola TaxID=2758564 RepID=A0A7W2TWN9_9GAMM|nr:ricin-type beta-trefoil lectin domain protein [Sediminihaliea albiluteola]MBA6413341.1 ricin-type beta-trefoil lectin domain protein [Sediminihaliea albiluteola]
MKPAYMLIALLVATAAPAVNAVSFNKEALKAMQQEGHKIVEQAESKRLYRAGAGLCLDSTGPRAVLKACNDKEAKQNWTSNEQQQLVASDGRCLGIANGAAVLQKCSAAKNQQWQHDDKKRLVNNLQQCLQFQGNLVAGANVIPAQCNDAPRQVWN